MTERGRRLSLGLAAAALVTTGWLWSVRNVSPPELWAAPPIGGNAFQVGFAREAGGPLELRWSNSILPGEPDGRFLVREWRWGAWQSVRISLGIAASGFLVVGIYRATEDVRYVNGISWVRVERSDEDHDAGQRRRSR